VTISLSVAVVSRWSLSQERVNFITDPSFLKNIQQFKVFIAYRAHKCEALFPRKREKRAI
jgi:hypothetical protein